MQNCVFQLWNIANINSFLSSHVFISLHSPQNAAQTHSHNWLLDLLFSHETCLSCPLIAVKGGQLTICIFIKICIYIFNGFFTCFGPWVLFSLSLTAGDTDAVECEQKNSFSESNLGTEAEKESSVHTYTCIRLLRR